MKKQMPYTVVIGVDMPTKVRFVFGRCEKNSASGIRIKQAEVIPWIHNRDADAAAREVRCC